VLPFVVSSILTVAVQEMNANKYKPLHWFGQALNIANKLRNPSACLVGRLNRGAYYAVAMDQLMLCA
jgi:hypothetical protein